MRGRGGGGSGDGGLEGGDSERTGGLGAVRWRGGVGAGGGGGGGGGGGKLLILGKSGVNLLLLKSTVG